MLKLDVFNSWIDGWTWEVRLGAGLVDAGTGYSHEDAKRRGERALRTIRDEMATLPVAEFVKNYPTSGHA